MSATTVTRRARRSRVQWARLVAEHADSGLSAQAFCARHDLGVGTFVRWQRHLNGSQRRRSPATFVELPVMPSTEATSARWELELELGGGMRLRVRRT